MEAIHQFSSSVTQGDGVTNSVYLIRDILRDLGYHSNIYAKSIGVHDAFHYSKIKNNSNTKLLVHHAIGHQDEIEQWILSRKNLLGLIYHNITPEKYTKEESQKKNIRKGLSQIKLFQSKMIFGLGLSTFSTQDLIKNNYQYVYKIPLSIDIEKIIKHDYEKKLLEKYNSINLKILFVGRIVANKCQDNVIKAVGLISKHYNISIKLFLIGSKCPAYNAYLKNLIKRLDLEKNIFLLGKVSTKELYAYYRLCDIFVCLSEHEGFCIPLVEAMTFSLPIIALNNSAVGETVGSGGLLISNDATIEEIAALIYLTVNNKDLIKKIKKSQISHINNFKKAILTEELKRVIEKHF